MKKVIYKPNKTYYMTCSSCACIFCFDQEDVKYGTFAGVACPNCGQPQLLKWGYKELTNKAKRKLEKKYGIKLDK